MNSAVDLDAYFERVQWRGPVRPDRDVLSGLLRAHVTRIPFENFDVLLGRGVRLDIGALQDKLVRAGRGGYCFEQATLFAAVLEKLGFKVARHSARVVLFQPATESPRTHMFLTVSLPEGDFIVDPGFGFYTSRVPIPVLDGAKADGDDETHWLVREGGRWILRAQLGDKPVDAWVTTLESENPVDFEVANHFVATHPASPFVNRIMMSGFTRKEQLADRSSLRKFLNDHLGFDLPEIERLKVPAIPEWG